MEKVRYMISDAANIVNVESHVLRYWEDELELNVPRNELGHRYYTKENIQEFQRIKELKEQGYQLKAIRMIVHNMSPDAQAEVGAVHPGEKQDLHQVTCTSNEKVIKPEQQPGAQVSHIPDGYAVKADLPVAAGQNTPRSAQNESQSVLDNTDKMAQFTELMTQIVGTVIAANNQELRSYRGVTSPEVIPLAGEQVIKEMNYLMREQDEADEERFRKLDAAIRGNLKKKETKKRWGRNKKERA